MELFLIFLAVPIWLVALSVGYGWALSVLWGWFVVPTFNLPQLSVPVAIGLTMTARLLMPTSYAQGDTKANSPSDFFGIMLGSLAVIPTMVGFGWVIKQCV